MLNTKKVRLMAELDLYEKTEGRAALKSNNSVKRLNGTEAVKNIIFGIIAYLLIVFVVAAAEYDKAAEIYVSAGFVVMLVLFFAGMLIFVIAYFFFSRYMLLTRHEKIKGNLWKYNYKKKKLHNMLSGNTSDEGKEAGVGAEG